jgi:N-methylhydantoinase B
VLHDLNEGWITTERARSVYGVVTTGDAESDTQTIDGSATQALRASMRATVSGG